MTVCEGVCRSRGPIRGGGSRKGTDRPCGPGGCSNKATYTDGVYVYCTQHAKEPPTVFRKATGRIRPECRKLDP